jgi:subtilisin-like proprotein convertase family protein
MRGRRAWLVLGLLCLAGGLWLLRGGHAPVRHPAPNAPAVSASGASAKAQAASAVPGHPGTIAATPSSSANTVKPGQNLAYHLSNTRKSERELLRNDRAILLANADIDTTLPLNVLNIPDNLKAPADTQNWIVQANGPLNAQFSALLASAGAQVVSYIPNNAELVVASSSVAQELAGSALVAAVLPYQPYYKLTDPALLKLAVTGADLPPDVGLRLGVLPGQQGATLAALSTLGAEVVGSEPSPFGTTLDVHPASGTFINIVNFPGVMIVEAMHLRGAANDLTRQRLGVSVNTTTNTDYLSLSGLGVFVNVNDSGVDDTHPDLTGRITLDPTANGTDPNGHGTHVIGTILGSGRESGTVGTNASGSVTNANFRGMATNAQAYVIALDALDTRPGGVVGIPPSDAYLQETAGRTNVFISNNSWDYGGDAEYDMAAASYDAAVRDAVPEVTGPQPILYVFSAGNDGGGGTDGTAGIADTILSPGTAKNVITVGAIEQFRNITNKYVIGSGTNGITNQAWLVETDSSNQVADFSSRGNVGVGIEGPNGRFKPDVVAPGTFTLSDKSQQWDQAEYYNPTNSTFNTLFNQAVTNNSLEPYSIVIPANAVGFSVFVETNDFSPEPFPALQVYVGYDDNPTTNVGGFNEVGNSNSVTVTTPALPVGQRIFFSVGNTTNGFVSYDLVTVVETTNDNGNLLTVLSNLNTSLGPYYRYESGTSMAAASVSGTLALMQEFLETRLHLSAPSPALFKALLINGARTVGSQYDFNVTGAVTSAGWGLPNLSNSIPGALTNGGATVPMQFFDQSTNMLATGQSQTWNLKLANGQSTQPLRVTLVWTDPPGNPAAGVKLVNDLDLVVTNTDNGSVFYGNDIPAGSDFNVAHAATNNVPNPDSVNNVENVYLFPPLNTNYSITVFGHRVNVNAVDANTSGVVQDYALVVSYGDGGAFSNAFTMTGGALASSNAPTLGTITNGLPLLNQRVGGNSQFSYNWPDSTNGVTNQWQFYVYTNPGTNTQVTNVSAAFTNVAFVTYDPANLGVPRMGTREEADPANGVRTEADIDLYVSQDPTLTNLNPAAVNAALKSVTRTGTEKVLITNSSPGQTYYVGVKSEDQQGAQYALVGVALTNSFGQVDSNGNVILTIIAPALPASIPTGTPAHPGSVTMLALTTVDLQARKVVVADTVQHQQFGDLVGAIGHGTKVVVLNNHSFFANPNDTTETFVYDDTGEVDDQYVFNPAKGGYQPPFSEMSVAGVPPFNTPLGPRHTDGPGSLTTFAADNMSDGIWTLSMVNDSSPVDTGFINNLNVFIEPQQESNGIVTTISQDSWFYDFINVPADATNLTITVGSQTAGNGVDLYLRRGAFPDFSDFDKFAFIPSIGGQLTLGLFDDPPLNAGTYFIGVYNPNPEPVTVNLHWVVGTAPAAPQPYVVVSPGNEPIPDDAVMYSTNYVGENSSVVSAEVGVRINHPRESDLVLTLVSPEGTRVLLAENRGGLDTNGYGSGQNTTNYIQPSPATGSFTPTNTVIPVGTNSGTLLINYNFFTIDDDMRIYYGNTRIFDSGLINGAGTFSVDFGPGTSNTVTIAMNEPGTNPNGTNGDAWQYQVTEITKSATYAWFTEDTNKTTTPIKFAVPPFGSGAAFTPAVTNMTSTFDTTAPGNYVAPQPLDGWTATGSSSNPVTVVSVNVLATNEGSATAGPNVLALHNGGITRVLPTVAGKNYVLSFMAHGRPVANNPAGWWKAEGNTLDSSGNGNNGGMQGGLLYTNGEVGQAFSFDGTSAGVVIPGSSSLDVGANGEFTIEGWIEPDSVTSATEQPLVAWNNGTGNLGVHFQINQPVGNGGTGPGSFFSTISDTTGAPHNIVSPPNVLSTTIWNHVALTYDRASGNAALYLNGNVESAPNLGVFTPLTSSNYSLYLGYVPPVPGFAVNYLPGLMDETAVYASALSQLQIQDIYAAGSAGKLPVGMDGVQVAAYAVLSGVTNSFAAGDQWSSIVIPFTAPSNNMVLSIQAINANNNGMLVDSFQLVQIPNPDTNNYYLPEETLDTLQGEDAQGNWKLEVLDNRLGATNPPPMLVSWELSLGLERVNPSAMVLSDGVPVTNTIPPNFIEYYIVNVPTWATQASNILGVVTGGPVQFLFNQNSLPGLTNGDVNLLPPSTGVGGTVILTAATAPALLPGQTYYLAVTNTSPTTPATVTVQVNFDITVLTDTVPLTSTIQPITTQPRYFQFNVPPALPSAVAYLLYNMTGNADLVVSKGFPLPTLTSHNYISANPGTNSEFITVSPGSAPVPLSSGAWYLGVYNNDVNPVTYTVEAASLTSTIIPLTNDERLTMTNITPLQSLETFFSFNITTAPPGALFEVYNMNGDVDLTLNPVNVLPFGGPIFQSSSNPGTNDEQIVIRPTTTGPNPLNGTWYLAVPSQAQGNVTYTIHAVVTGTNGLLVSGVPIAPVVTLPVSPTTSGPTLTWYAVNGECYEVDSSPDLINWTPLPIFPNPVTAFGSTISVTDPNPIVGVPITFYRIVQVQCQ